MRAEIPLREITTQELWQEVQRLKTELKTHNHLTFGSQLLTGEVAGIMQSPNFASGSSGWQLLPSGSVELNKGYFRGDLVIGSGNDVIIADPDHASYRFWIGHATDPTLADFAVEKTGILHAAGVIIDAAHSNLMLYEAVVDAAGYGDYTTIAAALIAGKKSVFVRAGTYTISSNLVIPADTTIIGEDWTNTELAMDSASIVVDNNNIVLRDLKITGNASGTAAYIIDGNGDDVRVEHCQILVATDAYYRGPYFDGNRLSFVDCKITATGLMFLSLGNDANVDRNRFIGVDTDGADGCGAQLYFTGDDLLFTNNFFSRTDSSNTNYGLYATGDRNIIANNKILSDATFVIGVIISGVDTKIVNNHIVGWSTGIYMNSDYRQVCMGNTVVDCGGDGISVSGATNVGYGYKTVIGNVIYSPGDAGISGSFTRCVISGNAIYGAGGNGIEGVTGNEFWTTITNNEISDCTGHGIYLSGDTVYTVQYSIISNNRIQDCDTGIYADASNCVFVGNMSYSNNTNYDIDNVGGCIIEHNHG